MKQVSGLLFSQIGYDLHHPKRALIRGPQTYLLSDPEFFLINQNKQVVFTGQMTYWGVIWGSHWWIADFSKLNVEGTFNLIVIGTGNRFKNAKIKIGTDLLWNETWKPVALNQNERRQKLAIAPQGRNLGWYDAGTPWQEANSHAALLFGLCDLLEFKREKMCSEDILRLEKQIISGSDYLSFLQTKPLKKDLKRALFCIKDFLRRNIPKTLFFPPIPPKRAQHGPELPRFFLPPMKLKKTIIEIGHAKE